MSTRAQLKPSTALHSASSIGALAAEALLLELHTFPKPGLVSLVDSGSHSDMDAETFQSSVDALRPFFTDLAEAGAADAEMEELRAIGKEAEQAMLSATDGVNTHRGAIFGLGLLCAAAGALTQSVFAGDRRAAASFQGRDGSPSRSHFAWHRWNSTYSMRCQPTGKQSGTGSESHSYLLLEPGVLGAFVCHRWGSDILCGPLARQSRSSMAARRYGAGGARAEAAAGFPHVYRVGLPALRAGSHLANGNRNTACVQACFALIAVVQDTNLLHRSGSVGLLFAQRAVGNFLARGGVGRNNWQPQAIQIHNEFVARRLSPGGSADLLAATLFVSALETPVNPSASPSIQA